MNSYQQKPLTSFNAYQQKPFVNQIQYSPMLKSPVNNQSQNVVYSQQNYPRQYVNTPIKTGAYNFQNKIDMKQKSVNQIQSPSASNKGINVQQGKKFTPLSYKSQPKVIKDQDDKRNLYAKQTLQIVMIGFVILILIVGSFYSLILWDKMKNSSNENASQLSLQTNTTVLNGTVKIQPLSSKNENSQQTELKTLPNDQKNHLEFIERQKSSQPIIKKSHFRTNRISQIHHHQSVLPPSKRLHRFYQ